MSTQSIRDAVLDGDYVRAAELFTEWAQSRPVDDTALRDLAELAVWVRGVVLCAQAHAQGRIQALQDDAHVAAAYGR
jgi:hypothetical protein